MTAVDTPSMRRDDREWVAAQARLQKARAHLEERVVIPRSRPHAETLTPDDVVARLAVLATELAVIEGRDADEA